MLNKIQAIKETLSEMEENNCTEQEILDQLSQYIEPRVIEVVKEVKPVNPRYDYQADWYQQKKKLALIEDKKRKDEEKINLAKLRKTGWCYNCKTIRPFTDPQVKLENIKSESRKKIILESICPVCNKLIRTFGGYV